MIATIILFVVLLGILVFVHELGHFLMARRMGMGVEEFGFGFPPRAVGITRHQNTSKWRVLWGRASVDTAKTYGTIYSINWLPFGGFVRIKGEQGDNAEQQDSFAHKSAWRRSVVLVAGVAMNIILAFVLISAGFMMGLPGAIGDEAPSGAIISEQRLQILQVEPGSPAEQAGLQAGDVIIALDNFQPKRVEDFQNYTRPLLGTEMSIHYSRGQTILTTNLVPEALYDKNEGAIGIGLAETGLVRYPWYRALWEGFKTTGLLLAQIVIAFGSIIVSLVMGQGAGVDVAGPIGVAALTGQVAQLGFIYVLQFAALLSLNLAIINIIPFPALDGGRLLFVGIEKIRGRAMKQRTEALINNIGFLTLITLIVLVTVRDISRFTSFFS